MPFVSLVTASEDLARCYEAFAQDLTGVQRHTNRTVRDGVFNPMHTTDAAATLAAYLYQSGDLALDRKAAAATEVARWLRPPGMRRAYKTKRWTPAEDTIALSDRPIAEIAEERGHTDKSVSRRRGRLRAKDRS